MGRQYQVGPDEFSSRPPTGRRQVSTRGLGQRHWAVLAVLSEHGALHTGQVATLLFGSRPAAARHLGVLVEAGLIWRFVFDNDSRHLAFYELSVDGREAIADRLRSAGRPVPVALGSPGRSLLVVNEFFVALAGQARQGRGELFRWRRALEAAVWLREQGVPDVAPAAYGVWIENDRAVRFLLHVDADPLAWATDAVPRSPGEALEGYRQGVPVTAVVMVCSEASEHTILTDAGVAGLPVVVAVTTPRRLAAAGSPAEAVWSRAGGDPERLVRLIDLADQ